MNFRNLSNYIPKIENFNLENFQLTDAVLNGATDIIKVNMNDCKAVHVIPGKIKKMYTSGVGGCQITSILAPGKNDYPIFIKSHYAPYPQTTVNTNLTELNRVIKQNKPLIDQNKKPKILYMLPKRDSGNYNKPLLNNLKETIANNFPQGVESELVLYTPPKDIRMSSDYIVDFPKKKGELIQCRLFGTDFGNFGKL